MLFTSKVSAAYGTLTHSQKVVANYVDENYEDIAFSTLEELAEKIGVSTTTVIRFARALDYSGFSEMQDSIKKEIHTRFFLMHISFIIYSYLNTYRIFYPVDN